MKKFMLISERNLWYNYCKDGYRFANALVMYVSNKNGNWTVIQHPDKDVRDMYDSHGFIRVYKK
jgi:hypothetical protein